MPVGRRVLRGSAGSRGLGSEKVLNSPGFRGTSCLHQLAFMSKTRTCREHGSRVRQGPQSALPQKHGLPAPAGRCIEHGSAAGRALGSDKVLDPPDSEAPAACASWPSRSIQTCKEQGSRVRQGPESALPQRHGLPAPAGRRVLHESVGSRALESEKTLNPPCLSGAGCLRQLVVMLHTDLQGARTCSPQVLNSSLPSKLLVSAGRRVYKCWCWCWCWLICAGGAGASRDTEPGKDRSITWPQEVPVPAGSRDWHGCACSRLGEQKVMNTPDPRGTGCLYQLAITVDTHLDQGRIRCGDGSSTGLTSRVADFL